LTTIVIFSSVTKVSVLFQNVFFVETKNIAFSV
jgi:hypothetical protein